MKVIAFISLSIALFLYALPGAAQHPPPLEPVGGLSITLDDEGRPSEFIRFVKIGAAVTGVANSGGPAEIFVAPQVNLGLATRLPSPRWTIFLEGFGGLSFPHAQSTNTLGTFTVHSGACVKLLSRKELHVCPFLSLYYHTGYMRNAASHERAAYVNLQVFGGGIELLLPISDRLGVTIASELGSGVTIYTYPDSPDIVGATSGVAGALTLGVHRLFIRD